MASPYVLDNYDLQLMQANHATRFQLFVAFYNPVAMSVYSQDIQQDANGQPTIVANVDLLATHKAPYAPQPNLGSNRIGFVGEPLFFDGSRSSQRGNIPATNHVWAVSGANATTQVYNGPYTVGSQLQVIFSAPGLYTVSLTVSDRFGGTSTGIRQVMIYQDRMSAPVGVAGFSGVSGSMGNGGYSATLTSAFQLAPIPLPESLPIGQFLPITVLAETFIETTPGNWIPLTQSGPWGAPRPGQYYSDPRILFSGYVVSASAQQTSESDLTTYQLATADLLLKQASVHNIGYYHTSYNARTSSGVPTSLKTSGAAGQGQLVADLTSEDVYRSLALDHSTFGQFHDVHLTRDFLPTDPNNTAPAFDSKYTFYQLTYTTLSANEGAIWSAMQTLAANEFQQLWCERDSSLCIGPKLQLRGYEMLKQPTVYGRLAAKQILNAKTELQKVSGGKLVDDPVRQNQPVYLLNLWGPNALPVLQDAGGVYRRDLSALMGPPILCAFSDAPNYDTGLTPPSDPRLFPWTRANWPQDLAVHPFQNTISENYTDRTGLVKLVATVVNQQNFWAGWYPTGMFACNGLMPLYSAAGAWDVVTDLLLADISSANGAASQKLAWQYLWEMARRTFYANNKHYSAQLNLGLFPWAHLNDIVLVSRQNVQDGPKLFLLPMAISEVSIQLDLNAQTWQTQITADELTSVTIGPMQAPPCPMPKN